MSKVLFLNDSCLFVCFFVFETSLGEMFCCVYCCSMFGAGQKVKECSIKESRTYTFDSHKHVIQHEESTNMKILHVELLYIHLRE